MTNKQTPQTLMVRPVSTTTLTFDGKSKKIRTFRRPFSYNDKNATRND